jgi:copper transport protein
MMGGCTLIKKSIVAMMFIALLIVSGLGATNQAEAHASLVKAVPEPNSQVDKTPASLDLSFNERLESELYYIKIYDEIGRDAAKSEAVLSGDQKQLSLPLPELHDGLYTVTYHVISADGHPIRGTYALMIGDIPGRGAPTGDSEGLHDNHSLTTDMGLYDVIKYITRIVYYIALAALGGWVFWGMFGRIHEEGPRRRYTAWSLMLQRAHVLALLLLMATHYGELLGDQGLDKLLNLFLGTNVGRYWLIALVWSVAGFALLQRFRWLDGIWLASLLLAKSASGHAMSYGPGGASLVLDFVHLAAAVVWAGGLWLILVMRTKEPEYVRGFAPRFSLAALISLAVLLVTGTAATLAYLPHPSYLLYSQWGILMLVKIAAVLLVLAVGAVLRNAVRRKKELSGQWIRMDFSFMLIIMLVVGLLTYLSPVPPNQPLYWHEMGKTMHMTTKITPNVPGPENAFFVQLWMPEQLGAPKHVQLRLNPADKSEIAPIEVPLEAEAPEEDPGFTGADQLKKFAYRSSGPFLPYPGLWRIELRVMDKNDDEKVYEKEIRLY